MGLGVFWAVEPSKFFDAKAKVEGASSLQPLKSGKPWIVGLKYIHKKSYKQY